MIKEALSKIVSGGSLSEQEAAEVMEEIMTGTATPVLLAAFITALRMKGETVEEITGLVRVMRAKALHVRTSSHVVDTCGTGGDGAGTFNISTGAGLIVAAAGQPVAKHGNRGASSRCGSADVLEALGVKMDMGPEQVERSVEQTGFGFMFAPAFHPSLKYAGPTRREIGIRTVFNTLGPLSNPAGAQAQVLGVADDRLRHKMAEVLLRLGTRHALVVHGEDGVDEFSLCAATRVSEVYNGDIKEYRLEPEDFGLKRCAPADLQGGDATYNATLLRTIFSDPKGSAPAVVLCLNAAAALVAADYVPTLAEGIRLAQQTLKSGAVAQKLEEVVAFSKGA